MKSNQFKLKGRSGDGGVGAGWFNGIASRSISLGIPN